MTETVLHDRAAVPERDLGMLVEVVAWLGLMVLVGVNWGVQSPLFSLLSLAPLALYVWRMRRERPDEAVPGVWRSSRDTRVQHWIERLMPVYGVGVAIALAAIAPPERGVLAIAIAVVVVLSFLSRLPSAWRRPISIEELRIDEAGLFSAALRRRIAWDEITEIRPRHPADKGGLRLKLASGEELVVDLAPAGVTRERIVAAIETRRPGLLADAPFDVAGASVLARIAGA